MICLNMIVKNEAANIGRCLASVKEFVDCYLIADTGSTDNTIELIKETMVGIPGEVVSHDWVNFGHNRELALQLACAKTNVTYCLIMDADEELIVEDKSVFKKLNAHCYYIEMKLGSISYKVPRLINIKDVDWHWKGVVHNYLVGGSKCETLPGTMIVSPNRGKGGKSSGLSSKEKYLRDAQLLEQELQKNQNDARSRFYLAQSYRDAGENQLAYENYLKRIELGGWAEEVYYSMLQAATCKWKISGAFPLEDFLKAYNYRPTRIESLYEIARHFRLQKMYRVAHIFASLANSIPPSKDILFIRTDVQDWRMADELAVSAYWVGEYRECERLCDELLLSGKVPQREIARVTANRNYAIRKLERAWDYYDDLYRKTAETTRYEEIYRKVGSWTKGRVLDIACGTAQLARYVHDYSGFDFSIEALKKAQSPNVWAGNAYTENFDGYDTYVLLEVLEHLDDIQVLTRIPKGKLVIFSVPSFPDDAHIRTYTEMVVRDRFRQLIKIEKLVKFNWKGKWVEDGSESSQLIFLIRGRRL
jgi:glycosyltransferase involved in cell wall biosynthesis